MIFYGTHKFGWVDQVDGLGCVATRFAHIMWIPLIPLGSAFMVDDDRGYTMSMSMKSVLVAYFRAFLFWTAFGSVVALPATFGLTLCTAIPFGLAWLVFPFVFRKASAKRAAELMAQYGGVITAD